MQALRWPLLSNPRIGPEALSGAGFRNALSGARLGIEDFTIIKFYYYYYYSRL